MQKFKSDDFQNNLWTLLSSGIVAVYITIIVFITVRMVGLSEAGILSFAAATAVLLQVFVIFGVRPIQSTDIKQEFSLDSYLGLRVLSAFISSVIILVYVFISGFDRERAVIMLLLFFIYLADGFADVFMGDLQQKGKMRVAGRMRVSAFTASMVAFLLTAYISGSLIHSLVISGVAVFFVYISWILIYRKNFGRIRIAFNKIDIKKLVLTVLPFLIISFLTIFLFNIPKYYLGLLESDELVAIVTILIIPASLLNILCNSLFLGAEVTKTAGIYSKGDIIGMAKRINKQLLLAAGFAAFYLLCSFLFGLQLLSWVFNVDLSQYGKEFTAITLGGASFAFIAVLNAVTITMRLQKFVLICYITAAAITAPALWLMVLSHSISGVAYFALIIFVPLMFSYYVIYSIALKKKLQPNS